LCMGTLIKLDLITKEDSTLVKMEGWNHPSQ
jgi:hypothetical protein